MNAAEVPPDRRPRATDHYPSPTADLDKLLGVVYLRTSSCTSTDGFDLYRSPSSHPGKFFPTRGFQGLQRPRTVAGSEQLSCSIIWKRIRRHAQHHHPEGHLQALVDELPIRAKRPIPDIVRL